MAGADVDRGTRSRRRPPGCIRAGSAAAPPQEPASSFGVFVLPSAKQRSHRSARERSLSRCAVRLAAKRVRATSRRSRFSYGWPVPPETNPAVEGVQGGYIARRHQGSTLAVVSGRVTPPECEDGRWNTDAPMADQVNRAPERDESAQDWSAERLQKVLARAGQGCRRVCEEIDRRRPGHRGR